MIFVGTRAFGKQNTGQRRRRPDLAKLDLVLFQCLRTSTAEGRSEVKLSAVDNLIIIHNIHTDTLLHSHTEVNAFYIVLLLQFIIRAYASIYIC